MPSGKGKHGDDATRIREENNAAGVIVAVLGEKSGFSVSGTAEVILSLPKILREMADQIEADHAKAGNIKMVPQNGWFSSN